MTITRLGVDVGSVRIGIARSIGTIAIPMDAVPAGESSFDAVLALVDEYRVEEIIVGLPLQMDGSHGIAAQTCTDWADELSQRTSVPVTMKDERLTTKQAQRGLHEAGRNIKTSRSVIDSASAVVLLQACLDRVQ